MIDFKRFFRGFRKKRFTFKFIFSDAYWMVNLGNHVFPVDKYRVIYENLLYMGAQKENFLSPEPGLKEDILLVHSVKYLKKLEMGKLSHTEMMTMELPYSPELFEFARLTVGGTIITGKQALEDGLAVHIGGGFHHAFADHGEGFCILNDTAVALEKLKKEGNIQKAMIVDCDVHQGNGTADIFSKKDYVFTFSIHQMDIYPANKSSSSLDVGMWSGDGDEEYISAIRSNFPRLYEEFQPDLVFYLAGADPYEKDRLGGLRLTLEGLMERDKIVIGEARKLSLPVGILFAGGYAYNVQDTISVHLNTVKVSQKIQRKYS